MSTDDDAHPAPRAAPAAPADETEDRGVDVTLIDEMLAMSVRDRLRQNHRMLAMVGQLGRAVRLSSHAKDRLMLPILEATLRRTP